MYSAATTAGCPCSGGKGFRSLVDVERMEIMTNAQGDMIR
jgi:hypothetical protein